MVCSSRSHKRCLALWAAAAACIAALLCFAPLFRVVPLKTARQQSAGAAFDAPAFAEKFWNERLLKSADQAVDVGALCAALEHDRKAARARHGRSPGLSTIHYYFVSGTGRVASVQPGAVASACGEPGAMPAVVIETGPVFGNALRDGTGLLDVSDFANSQDFNAVSSELNRRVEERVLPVLRERAAVGARVRFVGCVEIANEDTDLDPLRIVPLIVEVEP